MGFVGGTGGLLLIAVVLWDIFETVILPRRVTRRIRLTSIFYRSTWFPWAAIAQLMPPGRRREGFLSVYGPLSLLLLLVVWVVGLIFGFALLQWGLGSHVTVQHGSVGFVNDLYFSGSTFLTLGLGDVIPTSPWAKFFTVVEVGAGFGVLAASIGYLPVLYQAFSRREVNVSLLDARAGSPPAAGEVLRRYGQPEHEAAAALTLREWERWAAELLESHLSYPFLAYFRSQHDNQSWLAALTTLLDASALRIAGIDDAAVDPARLTFAISRHAAVDLSQVFRVRPVPPDPDRLPPADLERLRADLAQVGVHLRSGEMFDYKLAKLRSMYEPYVNALSQFLLLPLPGWLPQEGSQEAWKMSAWEP